MSRRTIALGEAFHIKHGYAFKSQFFSPRGEYVILTPGNFREEGGFRLRPEKDRFYVGDIPEGFVLREGDLIVAMTEQAPGLLGSSAIVPQAHRYLHNQRLGLVEDLDEELLDRKYLYYLFNTRLVRGQISGSASGTKVRHTSPERLSRVKVSVPSVPKQRVIASILSAYDDLIENNRRRIELLEQAARLLYREWFVHLRFPGHEHVKISESVAEGWEKRRLGSTADITMGQSPKSIYYNEDGNGLPFHQGVKSFGFRFPKHQTFCTVNARMAEPGDILFSVRAPVGRINITLDRIVIGRGLAAIRSRFGQQSFLFYALKNVFFKEDLMGAGAIFPAITRKDLHEVEIPHPADHLVEMFLEQVQPLDRQVEILYRMSARLSHARDILLPRLMNGEIEI